MRRNLIMRAMAIMVGGAAVGGSVVACGQPAGAQRTASAVPACPAKAPAQPGAGPGPAPTALVHPGPVVASLCQFGTGKVRNSLIPRLVLRGAAAAGLAVVVDSAGPVSPFAARCDRPAGRFPFSQLIVFGYRAGRRQAVTVSQTGCMLAVLSSGSRSAVLTGPIADDLFALTGLNPHSHGPRTPNLVGLTAAAALAKVGAGPFSVAFDGALLDRAAPFGSVIFQAPPSGVRADDLDRQIGVQLAIASEPACTARQLALTYFGAEPSAGNIFAVIVIRDVSARPCRLIGPVRITGLDRRGHAVTRTVSGRLADLAVMTPHGIVRPGKLPALGTLTEAISLVAEYRDDPNGPSGLCLPHQIVPATWSVGLPGGIALSVPNADPASPAKLGSSGGFVTCRGRFGLTGPIRYFGT